MPPTIHPHRGDTMRPRFLALLLAMLIAQGAWAGKKDDAPAPTVTITVHAGKHARHNVPVVATVLLPEKSIQDNAFAIQLKGSDVKLFAQLTAPSLTNATAEPPKAGWSRRELHFIIPELASGKTMALEGTLQPLALRAA